MVDEYLGFPRFVPVWGYVFDRQQYRRAIFAGENGALNAAQKLNSGAAVSEYVWEDYR